MMTDVQELRRSWEALPLSVRALMRCHARHLREAQVPVPVSALDPAACRHAECIEQRERNDFIKEIRLKFSGPRHISALLGIDLQEAGAILLDGPRNLGERSRLRSIMDGA